MITTPVVEEKKFRIGKVVCLKSGSPNLTVVSLSGETVTVEWKTGEGVKRTSLPDACFEPAPNLVL